MRLRREVGSTVVPPKLGPVYSTWRQRMELRKWGFRVYGNCMIVCWIDIYWMEYIDKYFEEVYHIGRALINPDFPSALKSTLITDLVKCMGIGSMVMVIGRFTVYKRHYLFKNYVNSVMVGWLFGALYSPYFLSQKIDKHRLYVLLDQDQDM